MQNSQQNRRSRDAFVGVAPVIQIVPLCRNLRTLPSANPSSNFGDPRADFFAHLWFERSRCPMHYDRILATSASHGVQLLGRNNTWPINRDLCSFQKRTAMTLNVEPQPHSVELSEFSIFPTVTTAESMGAIDRATMLCSEVTLQKHQISGKVSATEFCCRKTENASSSPLHSYAHHTRH